MNQAIRLGFVAMLCAACSPEGPEPARLIASDMRMIPGATFQMGTDSFEVPHILEVTGLLRDGPLQPEMPSHSVTVSDFSLDTVDVTNADFHEFVTANPDWRPERADSGSHNGRYLEHWSSDGPADTISDHPVTFVTWYAAVAYCAWRGKRLPTEVEYEWAAQDSVSRAEYPWGDARPSAEVVNWGESGIDTTVPVGSYPPNPRGLYEMAGNVWRFTADPWLGSYSSMLADTLSVDLDDPRIRRVVRGGSWGANAANLRVRYRDSHRPFDAREMVGFRCARSTGAG